jgi:hypothetical protein
MSCLKIQKFLLIVLMSQDELWRLVEFVAFGASTWAIKNKQRAANFLHILFPLIVRGSRVALRHSLTNSAILDSMGIPPVSANVGFRPSNSKMAG